MSPALRRAAATLRPTAGTVITSIRPWGGDLSDLLIEDGRIVSVHPARATRFGSAQAIDGSTWSGIG